MEQVALSAEQLNTSEIINEDLKNSYGKIINFTPLLSYFDVGDMTPRVKETLTKIWTWAGEQTGNKDKESILHEIIKLKHRLGEPSMGEKPWAKILNYITIQNRINEDTKRLEEITNGSI